MLSEHREQLRGRQRISMAATLTLVLLLQASTLKLKPQPGERLSSQGAGEGKFKEVCYEMHAKELER